LFHDDYNNIVLILYMSILFSQNLVIQSFTVNFDFDDIYYPD
jgi:hypothetical protein